MKKQAEIIDNIRNERVKQDEKWGVQNHTPIEWCAILMEEVGEMAKEAHEYHFRGRYYKDTGQLERYEKELYQCAAVCLSMLESLERNEKNVDNLRRKNLTTGR